MCFRCGRTGHVVSECKARVVFDDETSSTSGSGNMVLALTEKASAARAKGNKSKKKKKKKKKKNSRRKAARASVASDNGPAATCAGGFVLAANDAIGVNRGGWILDSGASRHLVNDESLLIEPAACIHEIAMADGESLRLTRVGSVRV